MEKFVNIKAICPYFEIQETVPEEKAVKRLETIRDMFEMYHTPKSKILNVPSWLNPRRISFIRSRFHVPDARLYVNTIIANPELF